MVYRLYVEKKENIGNEAAELLGELKGLLEIKALRKLRLLNRYDVENIREELFESSVNTVFSEPQTDVVYRDLPDEGNGRDVHVFAVEYLPGQFDQRADSASQCIQIISREERPLIRSAKVYILYGELSEEEIKAVKSYVINPVEAREAATEMPETLEIPYNVPENVETLDGFRKLDAKELSGLIRELGLAMDEDDISFCQDYFRREDRDPTITEIRMIDTYWSDHCRHTTFLTALENVSFEEEYLQRSYEKYLNTRTELGVTKPVCLMDLATVAMKYLKRQGLMDKLDESDEINACTVKIEVEVDGVKEPWLLLFKNETHNHPTEIEPFGGAATCIGGAIRDPLSGRSYVYGAMRVTGASDPTVPVKDTLKGKLPQRKLVTTAAAGYSSYGNQIGLATGIVDEIYHPGYMAKRMEVGAVIAAAPAENVRREVPAPGDVVILLGGATGRDGIGGATGSSKAHDSHSVETCGAEVQKGNAPEERKLQRLFRNPLASKMIKRCNDFGAGGVSVAIGELAEGLDIDLDAVPKKYEGLDGTELAISESQERMAVVVEAGDVDDFLALAAEENLSATPVAKVKSEKRLTMTWRGSSIVDISREFLDSNGAPKSVKVVAGRTPDMAEILKGDALLYGGEYLTGASAEEKFTKLIGDLNNCSRQGLSERFDSTIGAGTVLMPFGGSRQLTPIQAMVQKISVEKGHTDDCSLMSYGFNPYISEKSPFHGAYLAVVESVSRLIATGAPFRDIYLSFQEYFERLGRNEESWGKPLSALLGAFEAQMDLGIGAIGGKDSMSGSFEDIHVPPTLISFAVTTAKTGDIVSPEFKKSGSTVLIISPLKDERGLPEIKSLKAVYKKVSDTLKLKEALACATPGTGGIADLLFKMSMGNGIGLKLEADMQERLFTYDYGSFILELPEDSQAASDMLVSGQGVYTVERIGNTTDKWEFASKDGSFSLEEAMKAYSGKLEEVYPIHADNGDMKSEHPAVKDKCDKADAGSGCVRTVVAGKPGVLIPAFPGTNCEYDAAKAFDDAGAQARIVVIRNLSPEALKYSIEEFADAVRDSQIVFIPGGFSGGDEPDGSAKFITAFFRNAEIKQSVADLLENRGGLMGGICNGFQALVKLGLVPYGRIMDEASGDMPTLTFNTIGRHQSRMVRTRVENCDSPWLSLCDPGDIISVPISHGEGRFLADDEWVKKLAENGQIATRYVDDAGNPTMDIRYNPNGSSYAIEGITSPDGRVFGRMGHSERRGSGLYLNIPGEYDSRMFEAAVRFFK